MLFSSVRVKKSKIKLINKAGRKQYIILGPTLGNNKVQFSRKTNLFRLHSKLGVRHDGCRVYSVFMRMPRRKYQSFAASNRLNLRYFCFLSETSVTRSLKKKSLCLKIFTGYSEHFCGISEKKFSRFYIIFVPSHQGLLRHPLSISQYPLPLPQQISSQRTIPQL